MPGTNAMMVNAKATSMELICGNHVLMIMRPKAMTNQMMSLISMAVILP